MTNGKRNRLKLKQARSAGTRSGAAKHAAKNRRLKAVCATPAEVTEFYRPRVIGEFDGTDSWLGADGKLGVAPRPIAKPQDFDPPPEPFGKDSYKYDEAVRGAISRADRLADRYADYAPGASGLNGPAAIMTGREFKEFCEELDRWQFIGEERTFRQVATDFLYEHQTAFYVAGLILVFITVSVMAA